MAMSSAAFVWGATVVASFSLVLYADAQTIDQYGPQGECISKSATTQICPPGYACVSDQCYKSDSPCITVGTSTLCPSGMMCVVSSVGNICIAPGPAATTPSTVPSVTSATTTPCVDQARPGQVSDCPRLAYLCNNRLYYYLMTEQCPRTCNRCGGTSGTVAPICVDKTGPNGVSNCAATAYLCNNAVYYNLMTEQCPRTCGRC